MNALAALVSGVLFALGLVISGMVNPAKVLNFLDLAGHWDPSLAFVLGGAIGVATPGFWLLKRRQKPLFAEAFNWPDRTDLDANLVVGGGVFGVGWGLVGICPGPAVTAAASLNPYVLYFVLAMLLGMYGGRYILSSGRSSA